jgi:isopentenyl phosphate kinase
MKNLIIVKFGGSVITTKTERKAINRRNLDLICNEIGIAFRESDKNLIIVHGGGSYGHPLAKRFGFRYSRQIGVKEDRGKTTNRNSGDVLKHYSKIKTTMEELNKKVVETLLLHETRAISFHPSDFCVTNEGNILSMFTNQIDLCLEKREIPVLHGDVVKDKTAGTVILSGDQILSYLAKEYKDILSFVVVGTDVDGVYTKDPKIEPDAVKLKVITPQLFNELKLKFTTSGVDVTGGMRKKVETLLELAKDGIDSIIIDIKKKGILSNLIKEGIPHGFERGTIIKK